MSQRVCLSWWILFSSPDKKFQSLNFCIRILKSKKAYISEKKYQRQGEPWEIFHTYVGKKPSPFVFCDLSHRNKCGLFACVQVCAREELQQPRVDVECEHDNCVRREKKGYGEGSKEKYAREKRGKGKTREIFWKKEEKDNRESKGRFVSIYIYIYNSRSHFKYIILYAVRVDCEKYRRQREEKRVF